MQYAETIVQEERSFCFGPHFICLFSSFLVKDKDLCFVLYAIRFVCIYSTKYVYVYSI
jgi:hypothetical protein